jgi:hypothetical protein
LECAFNGAPLPMERPQEPQKPSVQPDVTLHLVCGLYFENQEDAQDVANLISSKARKGTNWDYDIGSEYRYVTSDQNDGVGISAAKVFSQDLYNS